MSKSKRQQFRERRKRKKARTTLMWSALGVIIVATVGLYFWQTTQSPAPVGEVVEIPANASDHIPEDEDPGPFPSNPPAGGHHYTTEMDAGFYDENSSQAQIPYPAGYIGHSLEHGYVVFWYNCASLSVENCNTLKSEIKAVMADVGGAKLIAFPWPSLDVPVAMTSWGRLQRFTTFDPKLASAFIRANRNQAPEPNAP